MRDGWNIRRFLKWVGIYLATGVACAVLVVVGLSLYHSGGDDGTQGPVEVEDEVVEEVPTQSEVVEEVPTQAEMISCYQVVLTSYSDIGSKSYLRCNMFGSNTDTFLIVNKSSVLLNIAEDGSLTSLPPSEIPLGSLVTVYTYGVAGHGDLEVAALLIGENTAGYSFGKFTEAQDVVLTGVGGERTVTVWSMANSLDLVCVSDAVIRSGYSGAVFSSLNSPNKGDYFLYTRKPDFDIMEDGNLYYAETVIVLGLNS